MCDTPGCNREGKWNPVLLVYMNGDRSTAPSEAALSFKSCGSCKDPIRINSIMTKGVLERIQESFRRRTGIVPHRSWIDLGWRYIM